MEKSQGKFDCIYDHRAVYHNRLKERIESVFPNCPVSILNAGISGGSAEQGANRVQRDIVSAAPDLAVVCFGLNDVLCKTKENYTHSLSEIFGCLRKNNIDTILMTPNMLCTSVNPNLSVEWLIRTAESCASAQNSGKMDEYIQAARETAEKEDVLVCDCYADWKALEQRGADITSLLSNFINHPSREMHSLFSGRLFETILL